MNYERVLAIFLRISGIAMLLAIFAVFLPYSWMNQINGYLGLGTLPNLPIVGYLARSLSAFYAMYGVLILYLSFNIKRYIGVIHLLAVMGVVFSILIFGIDLIDGMPRYWTFGEGPFILLLSLVMLWLIKKCK